MPFDYAHTSGPFTDGQGRAPARMVLRQVGDNDFALLEDLRYDNDGDSVAISTKELQRTNLATIPTWLGWFMRRHGRHTASALMHDQQVGESSGTRVSYEERVAADRRFRLALRASGVPPVRAGLMWAAVTLATRRSETDRFVLLLSWLVTGLLGMALLGWGSANGNWWAIVVAVLLPFPAALLWERQWRAGLIAGPALPFVILGSVPGVFAYLVYMGFEAAWSLQSKQPPPRFDER